MSEEDQKFCDLCRERPATHHTCFGNTGETSHLCLTCFELSAQPAALDAYHHSMEVVRNGQCSHCGAPALGGSTGCGIPNFMEAQADLWCETCRLDLIEFSSRPENALPDFPFDDEAAQEQIIQQMADRERRQAEFMRQKIKARLA